MGISTSTGTLIAGQSRTFNLSPASAVTLTLSPNVRVTITETPATVAATGLGGNASRVHEPRLPGTFTYGPYPMGGTVVVAVASNSGSSVAWVRSDSIVAESADGAKSLVDGGGNVMSTLATDAIQSALVNTLPPYNTLPKRGAKVIPQLTPTDWYPDSLLATDGTYLYGSYSANTAQVVRYLIGSHTPILGGVPEVGRTITRIATTSTPGLIFLHVETAAGSGDIYRSTDYGNTVTKVLELGSRNQSAPVSGARSPSVVWLSDRNFCEASIGGRQVLLIGEYNFGTSRTTGGNNDAVCLYKSTDAGVTWTIAAEWNTDGLATVNDVANGGNHVRHIHAVRQNPLDGKIYILFGDASSLSGVTNDLQSAILQWDGTAAIASNATVDSNASGNPSAFKSISGTQQYRCVDILFEADGFYVMTDARAHTNTPEYPCGVFKYSYEDFTDNERVARTVLEVSGRSGYFGIKHPNGNHLWIDSVSSSDNVVAGAYFNSIHTSSSDRTMYARNAVCRSKTGGVIFVPQAFFMGGDNIYVVNSLNAPMKNGTAVMRISETLPWNGERADTVAPVFFVDGVNGTDDATTTDRILRGNAPGTNAFRTLQYAMTGSRVPHGGRIQLTAGTYSESTSINPVFFTTLCDTTEHVNVCGAGKELTVIGNNASASNWLFGPISGAVQQNWDFQDLRLTTFKSGAQQTILLFTSYALTAEFYTRLIRAEVGKRRGDISALVATDDAFQAIPINIAHGSVALRPNFRLVDSGLVYKNTVDTSNSAVLLFHNNTAGLPVADVDALRSYFWGGQIQHGGAAATLKLVNCIFGGSTVATGHISILTSATVSPTGYGNRFESNSPTKQVNNASTLPIVGAGQLGIAYVNQPLDAGGFLDPLRLVSQPGGRVKNARANDYSILPIW